jgi:hypothetical protein
MVAPLKTSRDLSRGGGDKVADGVAEGDGMQFCLASTLTVASIDQGGPDVSLAPWQGN